MPLWSGVHVRVPWVEQGWPTDTANLTHNRFNFLGPWSHQSATDPRPQARADDQHHSNKHAARHERISQAR